MDGNSGSWDEMEQRQNPIQETDRPTVFQFRLGGHLDPVWSDWFDGLAVTWHDTDTLLTGPVVDQAALHGLIRRIRDLGLPLLSINRINSGTGPHQRFEHPNEQIGGD